MKASIGSSGKLTIIPENPLEGYALSRWWEDWNSGRVCLEVEHDHPHMPGAVVVSEVENISGN